jgi:AmmeMemoRadiSam system protein B/AmmeMemoRadiSam system protein A
MASWLSPSFDWGCAAQPLLGSAAAPWWSWALAFVFCLTLGSCSSGGTGEGDKVRQPVFAGSWYEGSPAALDSSAACFLRGEGRPSVPFPEGSAEARQWAEQGRYPVAVVVPHAGHVYSGPCAGLTLGLLRGAKVRRVVLIGPSHRLSFRGAALPEEAAFATPLGRVELDHDAIQALGRQPGFAVHAAAHASEHSLEIELPLLQRALSPGFTLVPIVIGRVGRDELRSIGAAIASVLEEPGTILVVSSDFTHFGPNYDYQPFRTDVPRRLAELDGGAVRKILSRDLDGFESYLDSTDATICGAAPIRVLLEALKGRDLVGRWIDYYRSGDQLADFTNTVSYAGLAFFPAARTGAHAAAQAEPQAGTRAGAGAAKMPLEAPGARSLDTREQAFLLDFARQTVRAAVRRRPLPTTELPVGFTADSPLREHRGVFVTLTEKRDGQLRGCIGNILGDRPLVEGVLDNAVNAALHDPRFLAVTPEEEPRLHLEISVLTPLQAVSGPEAIVIGRDGVLLEKQGRRSVFLPQVAPEQGWDVPTMLRHLAMKAGLEPDDWKEGASFQIFQAQVFEEAH